MAQDDLLTRLYAVHDLSEVGAMDRAFVQQCMSELSSGAAAEVPHFQVNWGQLDAAVDAEDSDAIERLEDWIGYTQEHPLSEAEAEEIEAEARVHAEAAREDRPVISVSDFTPGRGAIWHWRRAWAEDASASAEGLTGTGPFTSLLVLRVHPEGTLDACMHHEVQYSPDYERSVHEGVPPSRVFLGMHTPLRVWLGLDPSKHDLWPDQGVDVDLGELAKLLKRLHLD